MKIKAYAKINLSLNVNSLKDNGYHSVDMVNSLISLFDTIKIKLIKKETIIVICDDVKSEENLVVKAARAFLNYSQIKKGVKIKLKKRIMISAGLGGGSSDAAAVLLALNKLSKKYYSFDQLNEIAAPLGADVSFFLQGKMARVQGQGEIIEPFNCQSIPLLIVKPASGINTGECYQEVDKQPYLHANIDKVIELIKKGDYDVLPFYIENSLQQAAIRLNPEIAEVLKQLKKHDLAGVLMSGSGSTCFAFDAEKKKKELKKIGKKLKKIYPHVYLVQLITLNLEKYY